MRIKNITFCDDIRREVGDKISVMGMLGNSVNINLPAGAPEKFPFQLSFLVTLENESQKYKEIVLSAELLANKEQVAQVNAHIELRGEDSIFHVPFPKFGTEVSESMDITMKAKVLADEALVTEDEATIHVQVNRQEVAAD